jgi:hypothetical protein
MPTPIFLQSTLNDEPNLRVHRASRGSARNTGFIRSVTDGALRLDSHPDEPGMPFSVELTSNTFEWIEQDVMTLHGTLVNPGLHWHLPHGDEGYYYVSQIYEIEGEISDVVSRDSSASTTCTCMGRSTRVIC